MNPRLRSQVRPTLDVLEARDNPASSWMFSWWAAYEQSILAPAVVSHPTAPVVSHPAPKPVSHAAPLAVTQASTVAVPTIGDKVAAFAQAHLGQRVGGGECAHLAAEALRASGARFAVFGGSSDYSWGSLVSQVTGQNGGATFSNPSARFRPGDVIQYSNAVFSDGTWATHHTSIVASVNAAGQVTAVYQQNFNGNRTVTEQGLDLTKLTAGSVKVYRPQARTPVAGVYQFSIVNNTGAAVGVSEQAGSSVSAYTLSSADTTASYETRTWTTWGGVYPTITVAGHTIAVQNGAGYEIYTTASGGVSIR